MDSELFEEVSEVEKAQFIGEFFSWIKNVFGSEKMMDTRDMMS